MWPSGLSQWYNWRLMGSKHMHCHKCTTRERSKYLQKKHGNVPFSKGKGRPARKGSCMPYLHVDPNIAQTFYVAVQWIRTCYWHSWRLWEESSQREQLLNAVLLLKEKVSWALVWYSQSSFKNPGARSKMMGLHGTKHWSNTNSLCSLNLFQTKPKTEELTLH